MKPNPSNPSQLSLLTRLVLSENWRVAEKWLLDPRLPNLFQYQFSDQEWVVIPKGRIVACSTNGAPNDDGLMSKCISHHLSNALTFANGGIDVPNEVDNIDRTFYTRTANRPIGVAAANIIAQRPNNMASTPPHVLPRGSYIELPLIDNQAAAERVHWGSAYGVLHGGDYVMSDQYGRFVEWQEYPTLTQTFTGVTADSSGTGSTAGAATVYVDQPIKNHVPLVQTFPVTISVVGHANQTPITTAQVIRVPYASGAVAMSGLGNGAVVDITVTYVSAIPQNYDQIIGQVMAIDTSLHPLDSFVGDVGSVRIMLL